MTEHYKGQRIDELLAEIARLTAVLNTFAFETLNQTEKDHVAKAYSQMAIMKAKLTALQGDAK
jgi:hypothetical protein